MESNWKQVFLQHYFSSLNPQQREAVFHINGPVLVLSGAGSGKTTVIVNRIVNMVMFGSAYNAPAEELSSYTASLLENYLNEETENFDCLVDEVSYNPVKPWNILAITFTNKAAGEMKARLQAKLGDSAEEINASTFHSACSRILRYDISRLGFSSNFTIYDTDDSKRLIKSCMKELDIDQKNFPVKTVMNTISLSKNSLISPQKFLNSEKEDMDEYRRHVIGSIYKYYQQRLKEANALDFDDLLFKTVELFEKNPDVLEKYQNRYKYILVDEYQDTNEAQYRIISLLSRKYGNLCVVGDDDQSIYKFRGATIKNILNFENQFPDCCIIRLEQNYRSTQTILDAANSIIRNNSQRKEKTLWTDLGKGSKIEWYKASDENAEARYIAKQIKKGVENGGKYSDYAVLYRMNALTNPLEKAFFNEIPYKIYGGLRFYDRKEIKDILAYMSVAVNEWDSVRMRRIVNEPKRGIGESTLSTIDTISRDLGISYLEIMKHADEYPVLSKRAPKLKAFADIIVDIKEKSEEMYLPEIVDYIIDKTGYKTAMQQLGEEGEERLQNIYELKSSIDAYCTENNDSDLEGFIESISLYTDVDNYKEDDDTVKLMTIHSSKGLEFKYVFITAMEDGIFPSIRNIMEKSEIEEERRLAYVAITRAKEKLYITTTAERRLFGHTNHNPPSEFLCEIDDRLINKEGKAAERKKTELSQSLNKKQCKKNEFSADLSQLKVGVRINHRKFGDGTIISSSPLGNDLLLEVCFDECGTKKITAVFAKLKLI